MHRLLKITLLSVLLLTLPTQARVNALFEENNDFVSIIIQGQDSDAQNLFDLMATEAQEDEYSSFKSVQIMEPFSLTCTKSKRVAGLVSCTLKIERHTWSSINKEDRSAVFTISDPSYIPDYAFHIPRDATEIYRSSDDRLVINFMRDLDGQIQIQLDAIFLAMPRA